MWNFYSSETIYYFLAITGLPDKSEEEKPGMHNELNMKVSMKYNFVPS